MYNSLMASQSLNDNLLVLVPTVPGLNRHIRGPGENYIAFKSQGPDGPSVAHVGTNTLKLVVLKVKIFLW